MSVAGFGDRRAHELTSHHAKMTIVFMKLAVPFRALSVAAAIALIMTGCATTGPSGAPDQTTTSGQSAQLTIATSFYPLEYLARDVAGPQANVENLTPPGAEPHDLELTPRQVAQIQDADVVIYLAGMQPAIDRAVTEAQPANAIEVSSLVKLIPADSDGHGHDHGQPDDSEHDHDDNHDHSGEHDHGTENGADAKNDHDGDQNHGDQPIDPHLWLDPTNMVIIAKSLSDTLTGLNPTDTAGYRDRTAQLTQALNDLDRRFTTGLQTCETRSFVTSHNAFGYLARRYDLQQLTIRGLRAEEEPAPARIAAIQQETKEYKITTIFYETLVSPEISQSIADDLSLKTDVLDPLEGLTPQSRGSDYVAVMDANLTALRTAGRCT